MKFATLAATLLMAGSFCYGDTVQGIGYFTNFGDTNQNGIPYWDNKSFDGDKMNVGYCLNGEGNCNMAGAPGKDLSYFGGLFGSAVKDISFKETGVLDMATMKIEIAGLANQNSFGWYDINSGAKYELFSGTAGAGSEKTFDPTAQFGFYLTNDLGTFFTQSSKNTADKGDQHFAIFRDNAAKGSEAYYLGIEDLLFSNSDRDYNDMIVKISASNTPEPASFAMLGLALAGAGAIKRMRSKKNA